MNFNCYYFSFAEAQEQVTANLANFSYDPLNYTYLKEAKAVELFLHLLSTHNPNLLLHGLAGLCNLCLGMTSDFLFLEQVRNQYKFLQIQSVSI